MIKNLKISMGLPLGYYDFKQSPPVHHPSRNRLGIF